MTTIETQKPTLTSKGHIQLDQTVTLWKNPIDTTGITLGFDLGLDYCSVDNTYCQIRTTIFFIIEDKK